MQTSLPDTRNFHGYSDVTPAQVDALRGKVHLVDVRERHEYHGDLGHIPGATLAPLASVIAASHHWPKDRQIVVICRSGGRSSQAAAALARLGFRHVHNMLGGMLRWHQEGRETAR